MTYTVITSNKNKSGIVDDTIGIVTGVTELKDVGDFPAAGLEEWFKQIKLVLGDDDIRIQFKISNLQTAPAYGIFASHNGMDPHVAIIGKHRLDGKKWGEE